MPKDWLNEAIVLATGLSPQELSAEGAKQYPEELPARSNREAHRLASRLMTERYGLMAALAAGLGMEGFEDLASRSSGAGGVWDWGDIAANVRGVKDAYGRTLEDLIR